MKKFQSFYNTNKADSIDNMFDDSWQDKDQPSKHITLWSPETVDRVTDKYGKLKSFKYLTQDKDEKDLALFKVVLDKSTIMVSMSLSKQKKLMNFRFDTSSPYYHKLLSTN